MFAALFCGPLSGWFDGPAFAQGLTPSSSLYFGQTDVGTTNTYSAQFEGPSNGVDIQSIVAVTQGVTGKDFSVVSTSCTGSVARPTRCSVIINFTPTQIGTRLGAMIVTDTSGSVVNTIYLTGVGLAPQFALAPATATMTASATTLNPANFTAGAGVLDAVGNLFFTDVLHSRILERSITGAYSEVASITGIGMSSGIAIDGSGYLYVSAGNSVYTLAPGSTTASILATPGITLISPAGLALDSSGDLYIADSAANTIYDVVLGGNSASALTLTGAGAQLSGPAGLAIYTYGVTNSHTNFNYGLSNTLYIADAGNNRILQVPLGSANNVATAVSTPTLSNPTGIALDGAQTLYIANTGGSSLIEAPQSGTPFTLTATNLTLSSPAGAVIQDNGDLTIADTNLGLIDIARSTAAISFPTPTVVGTLDTADDPLSLTVQETGNLTGTLNVSPDPAFSGPQGGAFLLASTSTCPTTGFAVGLICTYAINFDPTVVGPNNGTITLTTAATGDAALTTTNSATLFGIGLSTIDHFTLQAIPSTIDLHGSVELILTAVQKDGAVATDYTGVVTFSTSDPGGIYLGGITYNFTAADNGVLIIPAATGLQLNDLGVFTASVVDQTHPVPYSATSNQIFVVEPATLTLTSSVNPSLINASTTFTLHIATTGTVAPAGTVTFYSDGVAIGSGTVGANGSVSLPHSFATPGSYTITATYTSTSNTQGGTATLTQVVGNPTAVTLTSSVNPSQVGQSTTLTANISAFAATTGTVTFYSGSSVLGTATVNGTTAILPVSFSASGTYLLKAVYNSTDPSITGATSAPLTQVVLNVATITLTSSVNPILLDNPTILTVIATSTGATPTGTITFFDGATPLGSGALVNGTVSISSSFVYAGAHNLTASYSGDAVTAPAKSPVFVESVGDFTLTVASGGSSTASEIAAGTASYSLVLTPVFLSNLPSGVTLTVSGLPAGSTGVLTPTTIAAGAGSTPVGLTVTAAPITAQMHEQPLPNHGSPGRYAPIALALLALPVTWFRRRKRFGSILASICLLLAITAGISGCGTPSTGYYGQTPQTYNLTVTATSGNLVRSTYLTLTIQ